MALRQCGPIYAVFYSDSMEFYSSIELLRHCCMQGLDYCDSVELNSSIELLRHCVKNEY